MAMEELHEKRVDFVQKVQQVVSEDLHKNGLELETVSLTGLDQTGFKYFNENQSIQVKMEFFYKFLFFLIYLKKIPFLKNSIKFNKK